jgi:hypothetical protein
LKRAQHIGGQGCVHEDSWKNNMTSLERMRQKQLIADRRSHRKEGDRPRSERRTKLDRNRLSMTKPVRVVGD